jgi:glyoxylase-like metal-dependent hydrolase (beta-lactamase superfamily II)
MRVKTIVNGKWRENCYIAVDDDGHALIVDPGSDSETIAAEVAANGWRVVGIINTHAHYDHVGAVAPLQELYGAPFYLHGADAPLLKRANLYRMLFESHDPVRIPSISHDISALPPVFGIGPFSIAWIGTPGHTDGSVCLLVDEVLFSGDTLMHNTLGRTDLPGGNRARLLASVRKLMELPPSTIVYGGHGPATTLGAEFAAGTRVWEQLQ